jgi:tetratricopeptide (TPR) repeat protein
LLLGLASLGAFAPSVRAQSNVTVDGSRRLFAVMCALHAAGYDMNVNPATFHPVRARLREVLLRKQGPATEALRQFYRDHLLPDPAENLSRYVSFAQVIGPPPVFRFTVSRDELPPEVLALEGFREILVNFDHEAQIEELWQSVQADYLREIRRVQAPLSQIVVVATSYLREIIRVRAGRTFTVFVEPMIGGKTTLRNVGDHYYFMFNPGAELPLDEVRHAFLHFLLDPLPLRYRAATNAKRILLTYAARAPRLPRDYLDDFPSFLTECMVKAVELRLRKLPAEKLAAALNAADGDGFVMVRPLYRQLELDFEKAEPSMTLYFPDLLRGIAIGEEGKRLENLQFTPADLPATQPAEGASTNEVSELDQWLIEGDRHIAAKDGDAAKATYERILSKYPGQPRARYGLAVAAVLRRDAEQAKALFLGLVSSEDSGAAPPAEKKPPLVVAWSHVYLGRIYDLEGNRELAVTEYRAALAVPGAPEDALQAARRGLQKGFTPPAKKEGAPQPPELPMAGKAVILSVAKDLSV